MKKFDTQVQYLKYKVSREVARKAWDDTLYDKLLDIPKIIIPGPEPTTRCCIYKERAIVEERMKLAMGGDKNNPNVIEVINIACDECPVAGYEVTDVCRGCLAHRCQDACKRDAIYFDHNQKAHIDKTKCVECGKCSEVCPYGAIANFKRPCEKACKIKAISMGNDKAANIDNAKCIACGACVYQCPFGAIMDKSYILNVIDILKKANRTWEFEPQYSEDIAKEHEKYITEYFKGPVFITDWPKDIKAYYMKLNADEKTVAAVDLVVPEAGELMGGSQREENLDKLLARMKEFHINKDEISWYLDTRRYGGCIHSGFGMGFERLIMYLTGVENIRDVIPYPRTPKNCEF